MVKITLTTACAIFLMVNTSLSQEIVVDDFWGIPWGTKHSKVKEMMAKKEGLTIDKVNSDTATLIYDGGEFAGKPVEFISINAYSATGMHTATVVFDAPIESKVIDQYDDIKEKLIKKYGKPTNDYKFFTDPYEEGDGYETQAIRVGKGTFAAYWNFKSTSGDKVSILLQITESLKVRLTYQNDILFNIYKTNKESKEQDDL